MPPTLTTHRHTLPATTIVFTKQELKQLLISTAQSKIQNDWKFDSISENMFGDYVLKFIKLDIE